MANYLFTVYDEVHDVIKFFIQELNISTLSHDELVDVINSHLDNDAFVITRYYFKELDEYDIKSLIEVTMDGIKKLGLK